MLQQLLDLYTHGTDENIILNAPNYGTTPIAKVGASGSKGVNSPKIVTGMTPITFDATGVPIVATAAEILASSWYDYISQGTTLLVDGKTSKWANVQLLDGSQFVWIPRYAYKITYYTTSALTTLSTNNAKTAYGAIDVKFLAGTSSNVTSTDGTITDLPIGYIVHPAFTANIEAGGWDKELTGVWVAKYEAGSDSTYAVTSVNSKKYPVFKPSQYSYNNISIGESYSLSRILTASGNPYGLTVAADSHLMKNSEWGAVAYLTHSQYGRNATEVRINNYNLNVASGFYGVTGVGASTSNAVQNIPTDTLLSGIPTDNKYNGQYGVLASTTGNLYGIYDMSGGNWERTAGYISNGHVNLTTYGASLLTEIGSTKYKTMYAYNSGDTDVLNYSQSPNTTRVGEAIWETSTGGTGASSWLSDGSSFVCSSAPFFIRGGIYNYGSGAGVFYFSNSSGSANGNYGFRTVLAV